jgi:deoxyribodipyrimidine photo-lyase
VFIFDEEILTRLPDRFDRRVQYFHNTVTKLQNELKALGSDLVVRFGKPQQVFKGLLEEFGCEGVYLNRDHDPYPIRRDREVKALMAAQSCFFQEYQDHFVFERDQLMTDKGTPYTVFTPYSKKWLAQLAGDPSALQSYPSEAHGVNFNKQIPHCSVPTLEELGFKKTDLEIPPPQVEVDIIRRYELHRNDVFDANSTSQLGIHLRFGILSVRQLVRQALPLSKAFILELAWRDFFSQVLFHFPQVVKHSFRPEFDRVHWSQDQESFQRWKDGMTGFPLVDAGMRQLKATGQMPNRVRMNVASFLCKDLLIHWSWGERYFAGLLLDYDLSANNGNWQWAAGTGCDAAPYFRVFNPEIQRTKFDPKGEYVDRWVPEWKTSNYPKPMVNHAEASRNAIAEYAKVKK